MKAILTVLVTGVTAICLICIGCEPEPKVQPSNEITQQEYVEKTESIEATKSEVEEMELIDPSQDITDETYSMTAEEAQEIKNKIAKIAEEAEKELIKEEVIAPQPQPEAVVEETVEEAVEETVKETAVEIETQPDINETGSPQVAVKVNGIEIFDTEIEEFMKPQTEMLNKRYGNRAKDNRYNTTLKNMKRGATDRIITNKLIQQRMDNEGIVVTENEVNEYIEGIAASENMTLEQLKAVILRQVEFEQWKKQMQFDKHIGAMKLIENQNPGVFDINDAEVLEFYNKNDRMFKQPEKVKASHILIKPENTDTDPNTADAKAKIKAIKLLAEIKAGSDFTKLAKDHSACPSSANGGDLGFGTARTWVPNFSNAAFALEPNGISDVVKTRFGYHIIKVTDKKPAEVTTFEEAKDNIIRRLKMQKERKLSMDYSKQLKENAQIEYFGEYKELETQK